MSARSIDVEVIKEGDLAQSMEKAAKQFPASTETILKKEARNIAKDLGDRVTVEAKGHHYYDGDEEDQPKRLKNSFRQGKVIKSGTKYTVAVTSSAPHYHLYEEGHDLYSHNRKNKYGKGKAGTGKKIGHVAGRKTVARYMAQRSEYSEMIGEALLDEILKEAGF